MPRLNTLLLRKIYEPARNDRGILRPTPTEWVIRKAIGARVIIVKSGPGDEWSQNYTPVLLFEIMKYIDRVSMF